MNIVIAYDGSDCAKAAIDGLRRAGLPGKANALVVCAGETFLPTPSAPMDLPLSALPSRVAGTLVQARAQADQAKDEASALAHEGSRRAHGLFPHWGMYPEPVMGAPAEGVIQKAIDWQADLIVVGSHGRNALGRLVLGSVSTRVATEARCSVRVARHVVERNGSVRIIVGVDGSPGAQAAIAAVASRSWPGGTEARLIAVDDTIRPAGAASLVPNETQTRDPVDCAPELVASASAVTAAITQGVVGVTRATNLQPLPKGPSGCAGRARRQRSRFRRRVPR